MGKCVSCVKKIDEAYHEYIDDKQPNNNNNILPSIYKCKEKEISNTNINNNINSQISVEKNNIN